MNITSEPRCESSLPSHTLPALPSSPPVLALLPNTDDMDNEPKTESEPYQKQDAQPALKRINSDETERPSSAQESQHAPDDQASEDSDEEFNSDDSDPAHRIEDFDWEDLHHRYHEAMKVCHGEEAALMEEWKNLMLVLISSLSIKRKGC